MVIRFILSVATLLTVLLCLGITIWGIVLHQTFLTGVCALLTIMFGVLLVKSDFYYFFHPKG